MADLVFICWISLVSGYGGRGAAIPRPVAEQWVDYANKKYPDIKHWICTEGIL